MRTINPIRKNLVKQSILQGKSFKQSLLDAGYAVKTAEHNVSPNYKLIKTVVDDITKGFDKSMITAELVLSGLLKEYQTANKSSDRTKALELLGKYLALFTDKQQVNMDANIKRTEEEEDILRKYGFVNRLGTNIAKG